MARAATRSILPGDEVSDIGRRYFVVRGRPWRCTNPSLPPTDRDRLTHESMDAFDGPDSPDSPTDGQR